MSLAGWFIGIGLWCILSSLQANDFFLAMLSGLLGCSAFAIAGHEIKKALL